MVIQKEVEISRSSGTESVVGQITSTFTLTPPVGSVGEPDTGDMQRNAEVDDVPRV